MSDSPATLQVPQGGNGSGNAPSTTTSTLAGDDYTLDKKDGDHSPSEDGRDDTEKDAKDIPADDELRDDEYPSGIKLLFIVFALVMSIFLLALDMVRIYNTTSLLKTDR